MFTVFINNIAVKVDKSLTVLQACESVFVQIPVFCYHEKLSIAGNCRMCLVEIEKSIKPVASCALPLTDGMKIFTETPLVKKAREGVLEFLLLNHPLDCPVCDQGGECDLQDQTLVYGSDRSRFFGYKHSVEDKNCGPLIKTIMTRCIHCTRCVRFISEVVGVEVLGITGRGQKSEIGFYISNILNSELSGNIIDLCPVGALTGKPYSFSSRSWELLVGESVDVSDALGSNINVYSKNSEIIRILPRFNSEINEEWLSDKARFSFDGLQKQRLGFPLIKKNNDFVISTWEHAFLEIKKNIQMLDSSNICAIFGGLVDVYGYVSFKSFFNSIGVSNVLYERSSGVCVDFVSDYRFNSGITGVELADVCLIVGTNVRQEAALLNNRLRKKVIDGTLTVGVIGPKMDLSFDYQHLGFNVSTLFEILEGKHVFCKLLKKAKKPMVLFGMNPIELKKLSYIKKTLCNNTSIFNKLWNGFNLLHTDSNTVGLFDCGYSHKKVDIKKQQAVFLYNANPGLITENKNTFVVTIGTFWDKTAALSNVVLPAKTFVEQSGLVVNLEGRPQQFQKIISGPGNSIDDFKIFTGFSELLAPVRKTSKTKYVCLSNFYDAIRLISPNLACFNKVEKAIYFDVLNSGLFVWRGKSLRFVFDSFYNTNNITRLSKTMIACVLTYKKKRFI